MNQQKINTRAKVLFLALGLAVSVLTLTGFSSLMFHSLPKDRFVRAEGYIEDNFLKSVIKENYSGKSDIKSNILVLRNGKLTIFNFNTDSLCGFGGCLYTVYVGNRRMASLLLKSIPDNSGDFVSGFVNPAALISVDKEQDKNGLSCFVTIQSGENQNEVLSTRYCYQEGGFVKVLEKVMGKNEQRSLPY